MVQTKENSGVTSPVANEGLIGRTSIAFAAGDNLTTAKTATVSLSTTKQDVLHKDGLYHIYVDKAIEDTAGNLTVNVYNQVKIDGTNSRDVLIATQTVEMSAGVATYELLPIQGLFIGERSIKIGASFATDSTAITLYFAVYRI